MTEEEQRRWLEEDDEEEASRRGQEEEEASTHPWTHHVDPNSEPETPKQRSMKIRKERGFVRWAAWWLSVNVFY